MEQVWRNKKIVSKGWKSPFFLQQNEFGLRNEKYLKPTFFSRQSGFGLLDNDKRMYEG
jgi:hypothetical protein